VDFTKRSKDHEKFLKLLALDVPRALGVFAKLDFIVGLNVSLESKQLVLLANDDFKALAVFTSSASLTDFSSLARPLVLNGLEISEMAFNSPTKLLAIDPPSGHRLLTGSMLSAVIERENWLDPAQSKELKLEIASYLDENSELDFRVEVGQWSDLRIYLRGSGDEAAVIAPKLALFLKGSPIALSFMPSGADIIYETVD
jgi:hypothetical protein